MGARAVMLALLVVAALGVALVLRRREGRLRPVVAGTALTAADLGADLGDDATFVQFSTATCAPCRPVRRVLGEVVAGRSGVRHVDVDAVERLDLARAHRVVTTPTVLVLDASGAVRHRLSGRIDRGAAEAALDALEPTVAGRV